MLRNQISNLNLSLITPDTDNGNNKIPSNIQSVDKDSLHAFNAQIEWDERDNASTKLPPAGSQTQCIHIDAGLAGNQVVIVPLHRNGIQLVQSGYVRVHLVVSYEKNVKTAPEGAVWL